MKYGFSEFDFPEVQFFDASGMAEAVAASVGASYLWPSGRGRREHYGASAHDAPFELSNETLAWSWHHPKGRLHTLTWGTCMDDKLNIYLSAADAIRKFSPDGLMLWEHRTLPFQGMSVAFLANGAVYSCDTHGHIFALSMETGKRLWSTKLCREIAQDNGFVTVHDDVVVVASHGRFGERNLNVSGLNATDGGHLWSFTPDVPVWNFMASFPDDGTFVFQDLEGRAYRNRLSTGELIWKVGGYKGSWTDATATLGPNNILYTTNNFGAAGSAMCNSTGHLSAYRLSDGELLWRQITPRPPNVAPAVGTLREGVLSVVVPIGNQVMQGCQTDVNAYDALTGELQWVFEGPAQKDAWQAGDSPSWTRVMAGIRPVCLPNPWGAPTISASGTVYLGNQDGLFFALRDADGDGSVAGPAEVSSYDTKMTFAGTAAPSIAPGMIVATSCDSLFVFKGRVSLVE